MAVIYITKEISDFQGDLTSWVLKAFVYVLSCFQLFETPWTVARQTPLSMGILQTGILEWVAMPPPPGDLRNQASNKPRSPTLQADSLPSEPPGKPKNNGVGSLSLLQRIFPIQESNQGLLHCRRILYQLSYQGSLLINDQINRNLKRGGIVVGGTEFLEEGDICIYIIDSLYCTAETKTSFQSNLKKEIQSKMLTNSHC